MMSPPATVSPINTVGAAKGCDNATIQCTYTDVAVTPGTHFYFAVAQDSVTGRYSGPSNRVDVLVPTGTHNVILTWTPSTTSDPNKVIAYFIYRGAPATNLTGTPK